MTKHFESSGAARPASPQRGAAPVGQLHELPAVDLAAIVYLRAWCAGSPHREIIAKDFRLVLGDTAGTEAVGDFDDLMTTLLGHSRRPIMRHGLGCTCFGGDESAFANMIAAAVVQDRDDALLFASTLMTGNAMWSAVRMAERLGRVFLRLARLPKQAPEATHAPDPTSYRH